MKFVRDVNIAIRIAKFLVTQGAETIHVNQLPKKWHTADAVIREIADAQDLIVISKDSDFRDSFLLRRTPKKLVHVCLGNAATEDIIDLLRRDWLLLKDYAVAETFYLELNHNGLFPVVA